MKFSIEKVVKMTGISAASLRNWEKRYGFPCPERTETGHRFYSQRDIEFLKKAQELLCAGESLSELAGMYKQSCKDKLKELISKKEEVVDDVNYRVELIYAALLKFDITSTLLHYQILNVKLGPEKMFDRVFEVILFRLGQDWQARKISIAQEHFASAFVRNKLASFLAMDFPPTQEEVILVTSLSQERHEEGLLLTSAHLRLKGYPVYYFGAGLPLDELESLIKDLDPQILCLSYACKKRLLEDLPRLGNLLIPVSIGLYLMAEADLAELRSKSAKNIFYCQKSVGSEAAAFVEMVCHRR